MQFSVAPTLFRWLVQSLVRQSFSLKSIYLLHQVVFACIESLRKSEERLKTTGLFRVPGQNDVINQLQENFETMNLAGTDLDVEDVNNVASLLKLYFRKMAQPLIPYGHYDFFLEAAGAFSFSYQCFLLSALCCATRGKGRRKGSRKIQDTHCFHTDGIQVRGSV